MSVVRWSVEDLLSYQLTLPCLAKPAAFEEICEDCRKSEAEINGAVNLMSLQREEIQAGDAKGAESWKLVTDVKAVAKPKRNSNPSVPAASTSQNSKGGKSASKEKKNYNYEVDTIVPTKGARSSFGLLSLDDDNDKEDSDQSDHDE